MVYSREIEGRTFTFGVSGKLLKNALIMFDYETKSLWPVMMNRAVVGEMKGAYLEELPVIRKTTWGTWKEQHPETKVLSVEGREYVQRNVYGDGFAKGKMAVRPIENKDDRLPALKRVIGVVVGKSSRAYTLSRLRLEGVVRDRIAERPIVLAIDPARDAVGGFVARARGEDLEFEPELTDGHLEDHTGTLWDLESGDAVRGRFEGERLERVGIRDVFWYTWADYFPETTIYGD